ncbi:unnamed protein product, partial [Pylaiella littoralis]
MLICSYTIDPGQRGEIKTAACRVPPLRRSGPQHNRAFTMRRARGKSALKKRNQAKLRAKTVKIAEGARRETAATVVQAAYRGVRGRQVAAARRTRVVAATCLQRRYRGVLGRRLANECARCQKKHGPASVQPSRSSRTTDQQLGVFRPRTTEELASEITAMVNIEYFVERAKHVVMLMLTPTSFETRLNAGQWTVAIDFRCLGISPVNDEVFRVLSCFSSFSRTSARISSEMAEIDGLEMLRLMTEWAYAQQNNPASALCSILQKAAPAACRDRSFVQQHLDAGGALSMNVCEPPSIDISGVVSGSSSNTTNTNSNNDNNNNMQRANTADKAFFALKACLLRSLPSAESVADAQQQQQQGLASDDIEGAEIRMGGDEEDDDDDRAVPVQELRDGEVAASADRSQSDDGGSTYSSDDDREILLDDAKAACSDNATRSPHGTCPPPSPVSEAALVVGDENADKNGDGCAGTARGLSSSSLIVAQEDKDQVGSANRMQDEGFSSPTSTDGSAGWDGYDTNPEKTAVASTSSGSSGCSSRSGSPSLVVRHPAAAEERGDPVPSTYGGYDGGALSPASTDDNGSWGGYGKSPTSASSTSGSGLWGDSTRDSGVVTAASSTDEGGDDWPVPPVRAGSDDGGAWTPQVVDWFCRGGLADESESSHDRGEPPQLLGGQFPTTEKSAVEDPTNVQDDSPRDEMPFPAAAFGETAESRELKALLGVNSSSPPAKPGFGRTSPSLVLKGLLGVIPAPMVAETGFGRTGQSLALKDLLGVIPSMSGVEGRQTEEFASPVALGAGGPASMPAAGGNGDGDGGGTASFLPPGLGSAPSYPHQEAVEAVVGDSLPSFPPPPTPPISFTTCHFSPPGFGSCPQLPPQQQSAGLPGIIPPTLPGAAPVPSGALGMGIS